MLRFMVVIYMYTVPKATDVYFTVSEVRRATVFGCPVDGVDAGTQCGSVGSTV